MSKRKNYSNYYKEKSEDQIAKVEDEDVVELEIPSEVIKEIMTPNLGKVVKCNKLNVRKEPNAKSEIITVLDEGSTVEIISCDISGFRNIKTAELEGYCMSFYIEEIE